MGKKFFAAFACLAVVASILLGFVIDTKSASAFSQGPIRIEAMAWNMDGSLLAIGYDSGTVEIITAAEQHITTLTVSDASDLVTSMAWSPTENRFAVSLLHGGPIRVFDASNLEDIHLDMELQADYLVGEIEWSPYGSYLATRGETGGGASSQHAVQVWDSDTGELIATYSDNGYVLIDMDLNPQNPSEILITRTSSLGAEIVLWDSVSDSVLWHRSEPEYSVIYAAWSPDGSAFATTTQYIDESGNILPVVRFHDASTGDATASLSVETLLTGRIEWNPSPYLVISNSYIIQIWDIAQMEVVDTIQPVQPINALSWSPDGQQLVFGGRSETLEFYSVSGNTPSQNE